jgi:hypothetical protein
MIQKFTNFVDARQAILDIAGPNNEPLFECVGKEAKKNKKDPEKILKERLTAMGLEDAGDGA